MRSTARSRAEYEANTQPVEGWREGRLEIRGIDGKTNTFSKHFKAGAREGNESF
jgi:hypothetical protein